jgi:xylitol oxidase
MGFTPSAGKELQSEYFVPRRNGVDAILAVERLRDQVTPHLLISEIRTIQADDLWMITRYRQPSVSIHLHMEAGLARGQAPGCFPSLKRNSPHFSPPSLWQAVHTVAGRAPIEV